MEKCKNHILRINFKKVFIIFFALVLVFMIASGIYIGVNREQLKSNFKSSIAYSGNWDEDMQEIVISGNKTVGHGSNVIISQERGEGIMHFSGRGGHMGMEAVGFDHSDIPIGLCILVAVGMLMCIAWRIILVLWVYADATKRGQKGLKWALLPLFANLLGVILYLLFRKTVNKCPDCGKYNSKDASYCVNCGKQLVFYCANCSAALGDADNYCGKCGATTPQGNAAEEPADK